jgi:hypothetical protein
VVKAAHERDAMEKAAKEEPDRDASGGVPDEARGHSSVHGRPDGGNDDGDRRANASRSNHPATSLGSALGDPARRTLSFLKMEKNFPKKIRSQKSIFRFSLEKISGSGNLASDAAWHSEPCVKKRHLSASLRWGATPAA